MKKCSAFLSILLCSVLFLAACTSDSNSAADGESGNESVRETINVEVSPATEESLTAMSSVSGKLAPYTEIDVAYELGGILGSMAVEIGAKVQEGDVLASLRADDLQLQVDQANTSVLQAEAAVLSASSAVSASQANIDAADARISSAQASLAQVNDGARKQEKEQARLSVERAKTYFNKIETDLERMKILYDEGIISKSDYENMELQLNNAQKDVELAEESYSLILEGATEAQRKSAQAVIVEATAGKEQALSAKTQAESAKKQADATYKSAIIGKKQAELALAKTKLKAPISGVVLQKLADKGELANPGMPIYQIGRTDQLKVMLPVPDTEINEWKVGDQISISLYDAERIGKVTKINPTTNAGSGTVGVEVVIPNKKLDWIPGQVVKANRTTNANKGIVVPIGAVLSSGSEPYVFKVLDGHAVKTAVETGSLVDNKIHIVKGLEEGEEIVVRGGELLLDGDPVKTGGGKGE